jgi:hypothetical protein
MQPIINIINNFNVVNLRENYSWADQLLEEQYNRYALTADNAADMMEAGLLQERWSWVDQRLQQMWQPYALGPDNAEVSLERSQEFSEPIPIDESLLRQSLEEEDQDSNLLARKHFWFYASAAPMDIDEETLSGHKRLREEDVEEEPMGKKHRMQPPGNTVFIPIANQPMDLAADVDDDDDDDSLCEALDNLSIHSEQFDDPFAMDEDLVADEEEMVVDDDGYESDEWPHMLWNN